jgi:enoyl-CoA hydratase/carnithine racemase
MTEHTGITTSQVDGIRHITFARPEKLNVLTPATFEAVIESIDEGVRHDRAIVFSGAGDRAFCAGMNLNCFADLDPLGARELITGLGTMLTAVRKASIPTIAAINGYCLGAGFELALTCDVRIAAHGARFGLPEVKVGIPSVLDASLLKDYVGLGLAKEMILTGDLYDTTDVEGMRLFNQVVAPADLRAATEGMLDRLIVHTPQVVASQKRLFTAWQDLSHTAGLDASVEEFCRVFEYPETLEQIERARGELARPRNESRRQG